MDTVAGVAWLAEAGPVATGRRAREERSATISRRSIRAEEFDGRSAEIALATLPLSLRWWWGRRV